MADVCDVCKYSNVDENEIPCNCCTSEHSNFILAKAVDHPKHYNRPDAMECIDEMVLVFGKKAVASFCVCNAWKYRYRAADKGCAEDISKSDWYMRKYKELIENAGT